MTGDQFAQLAPDTVRSEFWPLLMASWLSSDRSRAKDLADTPEGRKSLHRGYLRNRFNSRPTDMPLAVIASHVIGEPHYAAHCFFARALYRVAERMTNRELLRISREAAPEPPIAAAVAGEIERRQSAGRFDLDKDCAAPEPRSREVLFDQLRHANREEEKILADRRTLVAQIVGNDLPTGYKLIPYEAAQASGEATFVLQDESDRDVAYPLTRSEAIERAWADVGHRRLPVQRIQPEDDVRVREIDRRLTDLRTERTRVCQQLNGAGSPIAKPLWEGVTKDGTPMKILRRTSGGDYEITIGPDRTLADAQQVQNWAGKPVGKLVPVQRGHEKAEAIGDIGKRTDFELTVTGSRIVASGFGPARKFWFRDGAGRSFYWITGSGELHRWDVGKTVRVRATIKARSEFRGAPYTELTRVKVLGETVELEGPTQSEAQRPATAVAV